ncbi:sensor histidine kinase [Enterococcus saccharolyticus]|nr:sensor histidine kinase [Enterococcus saccharolyticus]
MIQRIKQLYKNEYLINRLMHLYSVLLAGIIFIAVVALCLFANYTNRKNLINQVDVVENQLETFISNKAESMSQMYMELAGSYAALENVRNYIALSPEEYFAYTDKFWTDYQLDNRLSTILNGFFSTYVGLEEFYITLDDSDKYVKADRQNQNGMKMNGNLSQPSGLTVKRFIVDPYDFQPIGAIYSVFSKEIALGSVSDVVRDAGISAFVFDEKGTLLFSESNHLAKEDQQEMLDAVLNSKEIPNELAKRYFIQKKHTSRNLSYIILANRSVLMKKSFSESLLIFLVGLLLASVLLVILRRTFKRYLRQVASIVQITQTVGDGNLKARIDTSKVQEELYELATSINFMVASLDQFIKENYALEIKQRDAHMRALQSQINPHFLYNTLEYIRMYALSRQQEELAEVVYAFSALLRNNTNQEKTTTLAKELSFCEKYVYLYQMRYPDQVAYHFQIEESLKDLQIPKFTIQPLIENYFVHGIDYTRYDNAISVKALRKDQQIMIIVSDNGKGITEQRLQEIRQRFMDSEESFETSIGLKNVHERLKHWFEHFEMTIESGGCGTTILLKMDDSRRLDDV